ncbi:hypothetical protein QJS10_CPB14g01330 [Acorus calamus]|uniref:Uncharacterized protein n=1 Tax=Acorus calamus TaxID=4465 RepID=A0AAV9DD37_ACOCL|nr:hypothetical protein QJS10_CPB14g01330 [Acorus calamus]
MEKIRRSFYWAGEGGLAKQHQVAWSTICSPIDEGGLGIKRISDWNSAAPSTRFWELATGHPSLWADWMSRSTRNLNFENAPLKMETLLLQNTLRRFLECTTLKNRGYPSLLLGNRVADLLASYQSPIGQSLFDPSSFWKDLELLQKDDREGHSINVWTDPWLNGRGLKHWLSAMQDLFAGLTLINRGFLRELSSPSKIGALTLLIL